MRRWRFTVVAVVALLAAPASRAPGQLPAPGQPPSRPTAPTGPAIRVGALLPLTGAGAWFGAEIKQGLELAAAEVDPAGQPGAPTGAAPESKGPPTAPPAAPEAKEQPESKPATPDSSAADGAESGASGPSGTPAAAKERSRPPAEPIEPKDRPRTVTLVVQAVDVQPLSVKDADTEGTRLLGTGVTAVVTASPTPTLTVLPLAAARNVLVVHAGVPTERFPHGNRTLLQLRPSAGVRGDVLAARAWDRGIRRLAVLVGGDAFGRAVRAAVTAQWRQRGGQLVHDESVSLDAGDLRSRLRALSRQTPEAVVLGFEGTALGEAARALRGVGYAGQILAADDDRAALLAGGRALDGALLLADAFIPLPGSRGGRFARAYEAKHGQPPSRFAAAAYELGTLLVDVAQRSLKEGRSLSGARLRDALGSGRYPSLYTGELVVRDDGTIARPLALFRVEGDRLVFETYVGLDGRAVGGPEKSP